MAKQYDYKISDNEVQTHGLQGVSGNTLPNNSATENKLRFDELPMLIVDRHNGACDYFQTVIDSNKEDCDAADAAIIQVFNDKIRDEVFTLNAKMDINKNEATAQFEQVQNGVNTINTMIETGDISTTRISYGIDPPSGGANGDVYLQIIDA